MYRVAYYNNTGENEVDFDSYPPAFMLFHTLQSARGIDEIKVWDMDRVDADGYPDACIIHTWKPIKRRP